MQPRRRRYVGASAEKESKHFVKIILPSSIHGNQMRIPEEFINRFGDELSTLAAITVPDGRVWKMRLKKRGKHVLFCTQWREFVNYYSLSYGSQLVFRYEGNSNFHVLIFDITSAEICYPCKTSRDTYRKRSKVDDVNLKSGIKQKKEKSDFSVEKHLKSGCRENPSSNSSETAKDAANTLKPKNPSVTSTIKTDRLYVGCKFAGKYLKANVGMMLQNCNGDQWDVSCKCHSTGNRAMVIIRGWRKFVRENDLSDGDPCVLELIKRDPIVLKLTVPS
ncbi:hypothetical protein Fmac_010241 [Flemingia macrophylla]|uniref:TF-B3 domain-containing protein n=1 Tax=Flemingia macrophylla TaxID=520843 RepID=A0ABD1ML76_9FABA